MKIEVPFQKDIGFFGQVPIGTVIQWAGPLSQIDFTGDPPNSYFDPTQYGWLPCDGRPLSKQNYNALYCVIGDIYSGVMDPTNPSNQLNPSPPNDSFLIPDLRGLFVRCGNGNSPAFTDSRNIVQGSDTSPFGSGAWLIGSTQNFAVYEHTHDYTPPATSTTVANSGPAASAIGQPIETTGTYAPTKSGKPQWVSSTENRPVNIILHFLIKAS